MIIIRMNCAILLVLSDNMPGAIISKEYIWAEGVASLGFLPPEVHWMSTRFDLFGLRFLSEDHAATKSRMREKTGGKTGRKRWS